MKICLKLDEGKGEGCLTHEFRQRSTWEIKHVARVPEALSITPKILAEAGLGSEQELSGLMGQASGLISIIETWPSIEVRNNGQGSVYVVCRLDDYFVITAQPRQIFTEGVHKLQIGNLRLLMELIV